MTILKQHICSEEYLKDSFLEGVLKCKDRYVFNSVSYCQVTFQEGFIIHTFCQCFYQFAKSHSSEQICIYPQFRLYGNPHSFRSKFLKANSSITNILNYTLEIIHMISIRTGNIQKQDAREETQSFPEFPRTSNNINTR